MFGTDPKLSMAAENTISYAVSVYDKEPTRRPKTGEKLETFDVLAYMMRSDGPFRSLFVDVNGDVPLQTEVMQAAFDIYRPASAQYDKVQLMINRALEFARIHDHDRAEPVHILMALLSSHPNSTVRRTLNRLSIDSMTVALALMNSRMNLTVRPKERVEV